VQFTAFLKYDILHCNLVLFLVLNLPENWVDFYHLGSDGGTWCYPMFKDEEDPAYVQWQAIKVSYYHIIKQIVDIF